MANEMGRSASAYVAAAALCAWVCRAGLEDDGKWHISTQDDLIGLFDGAQGSFVSNDVVMDVDITVDLSEAEPQ